jgi:hypothetical protein
MEGNDFELTGETELSEEVPALGSRNEDPARRGLGSRSPDLGKLFPARSLVQEDTGEAASSPELRTGRGSLEDRAVLRIQDPVLGPMLFDLEALGQDPARKVPQGELELPEERPGREIVRLVLPVAPDQGMEMGPEEPLLDEKPENGPGRPHIPALLDQDILALQDMAMEFSQEVSLEGEEEEGPDRLLPISPGLLDDPEIIDKPDWIQRRLFPDLGPDLGRLGCSEKQSDSSLDRCRAFRKLDDGQDSFPIWSSLR